MDKKINVMLSTEGTYPFHPEGVSTWCDILVNQLRQVDYTVYSVMMNPFLSQIYSLPLSATLIKVPLWGTEEPSEYLDVPFSKVYISKNRTTDDVVRNKFIPLFRTLISEVISLEKNPTRLGGALHSMYLYFKEYEYKKSFKSEITWDVYKSMVYDYASVPENGLDQPSVYDLIQSLGWLYRFMVILNTPVPKTDVTHSAAAAFCGIPCVLAKIEYNTPYMLTEHGVYIREQYLSLSKRGYPSFLNTFFIRMINSIISLNYEYADTVAPVCRYNTRWEERFGVGSDKINVIYNGVDNKTFTPKDVKRKYREPTVVSVARIDPLKDILTLIEATNIARKEIPDIKVSLYGSVSVDEYYEECKKRVKTLGLENNFIFEGHTDNAPEAYNTGDIVVLTSISEAFPYSVVEAMMSGKPVVSTDVGGIKEALGDCGILATPGAPEEIAEGILTFLKDPDLIKEKSIASRKRALEFFSIEKVLENHYNSYMRLMTADREIKTVLPITLLQKQKFYAEKGYTLLSMGYVREAIEQFREAINASPNSPSVPVLMLEIANSYKRLGEHDKAELEVIKSSAMTGI
ncbi:MAG: Mannosylfructose-phosphate synthase [Firmicutes bacterium ADurb.Bin193]|nr:MAG: Mannosylfructose-phosphate synthase [Firmicutes bacterium ADurb.Bin193]